MDLLSKLEQNGARKCVACGRCTFACPASQIGGEFSPRGLVERMILEDKIPPEKEIWLCMTCKQCTQICQFGVSFHELVREVRPTLLTSLPPEENHGGIPRVLERLSAVRKIRPSRQRWITSGIDIDQSSDTLFYVGCTPYFDVIFRYLRQDLLEMPRSAIRLLNACGIAPRVLMHERCCGHDSYWLGDVETFQRLAFLNVEALERSGVREILTFCPECMITWKQLYPKMVGKLSFDVRSVTEVVAKAIEEGILRLERNEEVYTFQDPCRLGRHSGVYEPPRQLIRSIGRLVEMPRSREMAACCGNSSFVNCNAMTRQWQLQRGKEALASGADRLLTACPKCLIHLTCGLAEGWVSMERRSIRIDDLYVIAASRLSKKA
ncbi:MAG: (Fe-S)-binding protein [Methanomassiliicoccales archaeon]